MRADKQVQSSHFDGAINAGSRIRLYERLPRSGIQSAEHVNRRAWRNSANALGFRSVGDKKGLAAVFSPRSSDRFDATAIGIAFDHGGAFNRGVFRQPFPIGYDGRQIDPENAASF